MHPVLRARTTLGRLTLVVAVAAAALSGLPATSASAAAAPVTPTGLPAAAEALQPYVGQEICDPVAKPGVRAFSTLLLNTYRTTSSLGITRDCGSGGQSEHKEGRGWDWGVNAFDPAQKDIADSVVMWLLAPDANGNTHAMARRTGLMYMIWNGYIWKAYAAQQGWQPYTGPNPHTDHVHFSFGWNGARQVTSFWTKQVAPIDYGPSGPAPVVPVRSSDNLKVVATHGSTTLASGSSGAAVAVMQRGLLITADGSFGSGTRQSVVGFQEHQRLPVTGTFGPTEWRRLFPPPVIPFGSLDSVTDASNGTVLRGWAVDADTTAAIGVHVYVNGRPAAAATANTYRPDVNGPFPGSGVNRGYEISLDLADGRYDVCAYAINVGAGNNVLLACRPVAVSHAPRGYAELFTQKPGSLRVSGWALDPDTSGAIEVSSAAGAQVLSTVRADGARPDVALHYPALGANHGFTAEVPLAALPEGEPEVCATAKNAGRGADVRLNCTKAVVRHTPFGALDGVASVPGGVSVRGWGIEPDAPAAAAVRITVDGAAVATKTTDGSRADVAGAFPLYGAGRGYDFVITSPIAEGRHEVCATVVNTGPGRDTQVGCRPVDVRHRAFGAFDAVAADAAGQLAVSGWAIDPDTTSPIPVHVYVDGTPRASIMASSSRPDVAAAFPPFGDRHGYAMTLAGTFSKGNHSVCVYAINAGAGTDNPWLGCRTVTVV